MAAIIAGGVIGAALVIAARAQKRASAAEAEPDWATHSAYAEQGAMAWFD